MDLVRLVFSKKFVRDLSDFFSQNCMYKYKVSWSCELDDWELL